MNADSELRPSYRTLNEPTRLIGLSLSSWAGLIVAAGVGYAVLKVSPLPWRLNFSLVVIALGGPVALLIVREPGTIGPGRLLLEVLRWRVRPTRMEDSPDLAGATYLTEAPGPVASPHAAEDLAWPEAQR